PDPRVAAPAEQVARLVAKHVEPDLAQPARRELVRRVLLGRVRSAMLRDRIDLLETLDDAAHPGNSRSIAQPASGRSATTTNPGRQLVAPTNAPKTPG